MGHMSMTRRADVKNEMAGDLSRHLLRGYNWAIGQGREW